jgi:integrase
MATRERTKYPGVYQREAAGKLFKGKPDLCYDVTYKLDGKKIWEKIGWTSEGYTAKLAADIRSERLRSMRHGEELPRQKKKAPRFGDAWDKYRTWAERNKSRAGKDDISRYDKHLKAALADKRLDEIAPFDLERLKSDLLKRGLAPATVKHCLVIVRQVFNKAVAWGLYKGPNPVTAVKMPVLQNSRERFLSHAEADRLLERLKEVRTLNLHDMCLLALHTGLRRGEIFNLKGHDLDFENGVIRVADTKNLTTRHAYMTAATRSMLERRNPEAPDALVFPDRDGNKRVAMSKNFQRIVDELSFNASVTDRRQRVSFHTLRHTFASWLAMQGESLITLKDLLGHKTTAMTERYSHLIPDHKRRAVARLEDALNGSNNVVEMEGKK